MKKAFHSKIPKLKNKLSNTNILTNVTKFTKETTELEWKVENLKPLLYSLKKDKKTVPCEVATWEFSAGDDIDTSTDWYFKLDIQENDKKKKVLYLYLECECKSQDQITAGFRATVKSNKNPCALHYDSGFHLNNFDQESSEWGHNIGELSTIIGPSSEYLTRDGSLIFNIRFEMFGEVVNEDGTGTIPKTIGLVEKDSSDFLQDVMTKMLTDPDKSFADVRFRFPKEEGIELKAHKNILTARSPVFQKMFEVNMAEKASGIVVIEDMSSKSMKLVLRFIYTGGLLSNKKTNEIPWYNCVDEVVYASSKYELPQLRDFCDCNFIRACKKDNPSVVLDYLKLALLLELKTAAADIAKFLKINIEDMIADTLGKSD